MDSIAEAPVLLREADAQGVVTLILNRPARRNSLDLALLSELRRALDAIAADASVRAVVMAAEGRVFCAGHDLAELTLHRADPDRGESFFRSTMQECCGVMQAIASLPQPVIAAVEGVATAAGCQLVASCDLAIAGRNAAFCTPGVAIGLFCSTPAVALSRAVPARAAMQMLLTGDLIPAEEAHRIFLVNQVVQAGRAREQATMTARRIASRSALAIRMGKEAFRRQQGRELTDAYTEASEVMVRNMLADDAAEGIGAFLEKRAPVWQDR